MNPAKARSLALATILACLFGIAPDEAITAPSEGVGGHLVAEEITEENFASRHVGGPDSDGGVGDWFLGNGTLCAVISSPDHESALTPRGGVLIDLGHCDAENDQWAVLQPLLNLSQDEVVPVREITAHVGAEQARIQTRAIHAGVEILTTYAVDQKTPTALEITIRARRIAEGDRLFSIGSVLLHPTGQTPPFSLLRSDPESSKGFEYPDSDRQSLVSLLGALYSADLTVLVGGSGMPPISYGVERVSDMLFAGLPAPPSSTGTGSAPEAPTRDDAAASPLAFFSVTGLHYTLLNTLTRPLWFGEPDEAPGLLQLMQIPFMDVDAGSELVSRLRIWIGRRADVASITDQLFPEAARLTGSVDDPDARIHIDLASGAPVTELRPDSDGTFSVRLPPGDYVAHAMASADRKASVEFAVEPGESNPRLAPIVLGTPGWARLPTTFLGRIVFLDQDGSGPVVFGEDRLGFRIGDEAIPAGLEAPFLNLAGSPVDPTRVALAPGRYRVIAVRGPEYEAVETSLDIRAGRETPLALKPLARIRKTPGWIAADLHVHSGESFDSSLPQTQQIIAFAASGAEVLVATEHDRIFDPRPAIRATQLSDRLVSVTGVEVTSAFEGDDAPYSTGHLNAFPMEPVPGAYRGGAPTLEGRRLRDALFDMAKLDSDPFIQLNHPRPGPGDAHDDTYFSHLGIVGKPFDPTRLLARIPNRALIEKSPIHGGRDLDYHGVELMNGESLIRYRRVRADWFSLLLQGERIVGTSNSDSHRLGVIVGLPRTYVQLDDDELGAFDEAAFMKSLRKGRAYGSTGPLLEVHLDDAGLGELHAGSTGLLHVRVDAAPWVPIAEWRAFVNGELVHRAPIEAGQEASLPLAFDRDSFVTVEVEGPAEGLYREALPGFTPFAFSNPIFVDADQNGRFDAPGFPTDLPQTMTDPDRRD